MQRLSNVQPTNTFRAFSTVVDASTPKLKAEGHALDQFGEPRFLDQVKLFYQSAASKTGIDEQYLKMIQACNSVIRFNIPLRRDDGRLETVTCYR